MSDRDYQHSRILDVHRWSDHPEANKFVDEIYASFLNNHLQENIRIKKKASEGRTTGPLCSLVKRSRSKYRCSHVTICL